MKKFEVFTRATLVLIATMALVAVILQVINENTNTLETAYEIITFSVALVAVILAVLQGLDNARTSRELHKIAHEMKISIDEIHHIDRDNDKILREVREIDRENDDLRELITKPNKKN
ncbi:hypothetical protein FWD20_02815 [Candidatus Saccharibacteria bacterium]|nr:hypothetical protein [Candidatus Saccharibacteria bacterium]